MSEIDQTTQHNAALGEETTAACHHLAAQSQRLVDMVGAFRITGASVNAHDGTGLLHVAA